MAGLDLDALLAGEAEGAKREIKDAFAASTRRLPDLDGAGMQNGKLLALLRRAVKTADDNDPIGAARIALKALDLEPEHPLANQVMGLTLERMGRLSQAIDFYERAWRLNPSDSNVYYNLGLIAWKLDMLEGAEKFYRFALEFDPTSEEAVINLAGVLRDQARYEDSIEILRTAIYTKPENPLFWNSLGTAVLESGDPMHAITFYEETLRLKPDFGRAWHNLGYARNLIGETHASTEASNIALKYVQGPADRAEMLYGRSMSRLASTELTEGWDDYKVRLDKHYPSATVFLINKPMWEGEDSLAGKRLLLVGEQGVGDEVLFLNMAPDVAEDIGPEGHLTISCERRLIPLVQRSFPDATVVPHGTTRREGRSFRGVPAIENWEEIDLWCPMGTPAIRYRSKIEDFPDRPRYLVPDPERVETFRAQLAELPAGLKVGLCWKSKLMTAKRSKFFSPFQEWLRVLETPGTVWVNLQYGDVDEEIAIAASEHGITIHQMPELDIMNDLDGVAALGAALDACVGPTNASTNLAAAAGCQAWFMAQRRDWGLLGTDRLPWYTGSRAFWPESYGEWSGAMDKLARALAEFTAERQAA